MGCVGHQANQDQPVTQALKDLRVVKVLTDPRGNRAHRDFKVSKAQWVQWANLDPGEAKGHWDPLGLLDHQDL